MPTYEYRCGKCAHTWEKFQPITAEPEKVCPACGRKAAERLIGAGAGVIFKGSGFYETDYKRTGEKKPPGGDSKSGGECKDSSESGGDACKDCKKSDSCPAGGSSEE